MYSRFSSSPRIELLADHEASSETVLATRRRGRRNRSVIAWFVCHGRAIDDWRPIHHRLDRCGGWNIVLRDGIVCRRRRNRSRER
jgi:hypothetical protein